MDSGRYNVGDVSTSVWGPETVMKEEETSRTWQPSAGARNLLRALKGETSRTSTPATGIPDAGLEGKEERRGRGNQELIAEKN